MSIAAGRIEIQTAPDGARIRTGLWPARTGSRRGRVLLLHGRREFIEKYEEVIGELAARGFDVHTFDWRGQGLSERMLADRERGHIDSYETFLSDLDWFQSVAGNGEAGGWTVVLAHSMGGHVATRALLEGRLAADRVVLSAPMIDLPFSRLLRPFAGPIAAAGFAERYLPGAGGYDAGAVRFDGNALTSDPDRFRRMHAWIDRNPDLALGGPTWGWLAASLRSIAALRRLSQTAGRTVPVLVCGAEADRVVSVEAQRALCRRLPDFEFTGIPESRHEPLFAQDSIRRRLWAAFDAFVGT